MFLTATDRTAFILELEGVTRLALTEVRQGNIIFDLAVRTADTLTATDIQYAYGMDADSPLVSKTLATAKNDQLQVLEINPSYGAEGIVLFKTWKLTPRLPQP